MQILTGDLHGVAPEIRPGFTYVVFLCCEHRYLKISFQCPLDNKIYKIQSLMSNPENGI
jgi:hypothetical protein